MISYDPEYRHESQEGIGSRPANGVPPEASHSPALWTFFSGSRVEEQGNVEKGSYVGPWSR